MKLKFLSLAVLLMMSGACAELSLFSGGNNKTPLTTQGRINSCILSEAQDRVEEGTAFQSSVAVTAREIAGRCLKRLALQNSGLDNQAVLSATNALNSLKTSVK